MHTGAGARLPEQVKPVTRGAKDPEGPQQPAQAAEGGHQEDQEESPKEQQAKLGPGPDMAGQGHMVSRICGSYQALQHEGRASVLD